MKNRIRMIAGFAAAVVILQGLALLFLTPSGIGMIYPFAVRLHSEKIEPDSNTYAVYYNTRVDVSDADLLVIGIDGSVAESYDMLGHFTRFLKQYNNFSHVLLDFDRVSKKLASGLINETRENLFYTRLSALKTQVGLSEDYCDYLSELFVVNSTMAPVRKFDLDSYSSSNDSDTAAKAVRVADAFSRCDRSALCVVEASDFAPESTFRKELDNLLPDKKIIYINTIYSENCPSPETHDILSLPLTGSDAGIYFVDNSSLEPFYDYYRAVTDVFGRENLTEHPFDERYTGYYFVVVNGSEPDYAGDTDNTVNEEAESSGEDAA